ncbi:MAG: NHL repeat-containing protein [Desulfobacterales bacterium]|jgi:DNA-binding beta-propeller fold protein YncE|nr:NHL repeat-containing protein [Desulfobacterales bacterium]
MGRINQIIIFLSLFIVNLLVQANPGYGIRLIEAQPLFEVRDQLNQPSDVTVSKDGRIYVVDGVNSKIRIYDQGGRLVSSFGSAGAGSSQLRFPLGIDLDGSGNIYVADAGNHRVQIFSAQGDFIAKMDLPRGKIKPADPTDVAVDQTRQHCYVVDNDNHRILVYDLANLELIRTIGTPGSERRNFNYPFLMALDKDNYLYVVEVINTRVQVLNPEGLFVNFIGAWGVEEGEFYRPKGVALDRHNRVYVSDSYLGVIQVFDANGNFYAALGDPRTKKVKKFKTPVGLFIDHLNRLYVVEMRANKVSVFRLE